MVSEVLFITVLYWSCAVIMVFPPREMAAAGLTIERLLDQYLGSENITFIHYHMRRIAATYIIHTLLLPGYVMTLMKNNPWVSEFLDQEYHPQASTLFLVASLLPCVVVGCIVGVWWYSGWRRHPLSASLALYAPNNSPEAWKSVAADINTEFRRIDKFTSGESTVYKIVATDSWLLKITTYKIQLVQLRDAVLSLEGSHTTHGPQSSTSPRPQLLTIKIVPIREGVPTFSIRLTSLEFTELKRKVVNPIVNARQIVVQQSLSDMFLEAFTEIIHLNPHATVPASERQLCFGCQEISANVSLRRRCDPTEGGNTCQQCYCRPMWCISCLSKWFAFRQDQNNPESWLASRAPCPTCLSPFCLLDVSVIA